MEIIAKHVMEPVVPPSTHVSAISPELDELVVAMLSKEPDSRPTLVEVFEVAERIRQQHPSGVITHVRLEANHELTSSASNPLVVRFAEKQRAKEAALAKEGVRPSISRITLVVLVLLAMIASGVGMFLVMRAIA
jgi:hypothetical protein